MLSIRGTNFRACSACGKMWTVFTCTTHAQHTRNEFYRILSIRGTNFIACWAYWEPISSHAEHARKCLNVEYLGRIEYDFQKSRVTGPWDHKDSVSTKKVKKKISCLCTFKCILAHCTYLRLLFLQIYWSVELAAMQLHDGKNVKPVCTGGSMFIWSNWFWLMCESGRDLLHPLPPHNRKWRSKPNMSSTWRACTAFLSYTRLPSMSCLTFLLDIYLQSASCTFYF